MEYGYFKRTLRQVYDLIKDSHNKTERFKF